jgi:4-amino-4-deoxychorismate lyase
VTAGTKELWVSAEEYTEPTVIIYRGNIPFFTPAAKKVAILKEVKRSKPEYFDQTGFRIKSMDYLSAKMAKMELKKIGRNLDGILLTPDGHIAEGLTSNIFWAKGGVLFTPPLDIGILPGTVRAHLLSTNRVNEVLANAKELEAADEIILTSGSSHLNPVSFINDIRKPGTDGPIFKQLYEQLIKDIQRLSKPLT